MTAMVENLAGVNARDGGIAANHFLQNRESAALVTTES